MTTQLDPEVASVALLPGREAASRQHERVERRRGKIFDSGLLGMLAQSTAIAYAVATWAEPYRSVILPVVASACAAGLVLMLADRRLAASRWYGVVTVVFTIQQVITVAVAALASGGAASPPALAFICILMFVTISSSPLSSLVFGGFVVAVFLAVAALGGPAPTAYVPIYVAAMLITWFVCSRQAGVMHAQRIALDRISRTDPLTGLLNLRGLDEAFGIEISRAHRDGTELSLVTLDLDDFKAVNDTNGHAAGDELLRWTAATLTRSLRSHDRVARLGGDEFVALLTTTGPGQAGDLLGRMHDALAPRSPFSAGIACYPRDGATADELLHCADLRLYADKERRHAGR